MGEAKRRGSFEERKKWAEDKAKAEQTERDQLRLARKAVEKQKDPRMRVLMAAALGMATAGKQLK